MNCCVLRPGIRRWPKADGRLLRPNQDKATWTQPEADAKEELLRIAKQAGFSQETFDQCLADRELFNKITEMRQQAHDKFGVDSVPTFFVNGKRLTNEHQVKDFEAMLTGSGRLAARKPG